MTKEQEEMIANLSQVRKAELAAEILNRCEPNYRNLKAFFDTINDGTVTQLHKRLNDWLS